MINSELLKELEDNDILNIEKIYEDNSILYVVSKFGNGRVYIYKDALSKNYELMGPYDTIEDVDDIIFFTLPSSTLVYKKDDKVEKVTRSNLDLVYETEVLLTEPIPNKNIEKAKQYLLEDNMEDYFKSDLSIDETTRNKIEKIEWILISDRKIIVRIKTNDCLNDNELTVLSDWIEGQNADGLMENFGEQFGEEDFDTGEYILYPSPILSNYAIHLMED